jgi:hypothetical protein
MMSRVKSLLCAKCRSKETLRVYSRFEKTFKPIGWVCSKCLHSWIIPSEFMFPKPPKPKDLEPIIYSGNKEGVRGRGQYRPLTPWSGIDEEL